MNEETLIAVQAILQMNKNVDAYNACLKFVPNAKKVIGVRMPVINEIAKQYKNENIALVKDLWKSGYYEERILAAKLLGKMAKKNPDDALQLTSLFSKDIDNWALCDTIGMQSLKPIVKTHQQEIFKLSNVLIHSNFMWQRRLALVLVEWYTRNKHHHPTIQLLINQVAKDNEYYVKKAIVWLEKGLKMNR